VDFRFLVTAVGVGPRAVAVRFPDSTTVAELGAALARHLGVGNGSDPTPVRCRRLGALLNPAAKLVDCGLQMGDELDLDPAAAGDPAFDSGAGAVVELAVVGGPASGHRYPLPPGEHIVGRGEESTILVADDAVSRQHVVLTVSESGDVRIRDVDSSNGTFVDGVAVHEDRPLARDEMLEIGNSLLRASDPAPRSRRAAPDADGHLRFNRPPRTIERPAAGAASLSIPTARASGFHLPLSAALAALVLGIAMYLFTHQLASLVVAGLSPVMAVFSVFEDRILGRRGQARARTEFKEQLAVVETRAAGASRAEAIRLRRDHPDAATLLARATVLHPRLWERRPADVDFLDLRVGWGDRPSSFRVELHGGDDALRAEADRRLALQTQMTGVPSTLRVAEAGVVGLAGRRPDVDAVARWLLCQAATLHSPRDLTVAGAVAEAAAGSWAWLGWLPHVNSATGGEPGLVAGAEAAAGLVDRLLEEVNARKGRRADAGHQGQPSEEAVLVLFDGSLNVPRPRVAQLLANGPGVGIYVVWLGAEVRDLPGECGAVVEVGEGLRGVEIVRPASGERRSAASGDGISFELATELVLGLAPVRDVSAQQSGGGVPAEVSLLELLDLHQDGAEQVARAWRQYEGRLSAPVGSAARGPFELSLREDGPHALVGGMTGSGKSEFLQTLVAALAARCSPSRLNFLFVDYKGGAAFKDCVEIPHAVGLVTDLQGRLVQRALVSLAAELRWREALLAKAGAKDLKELEQRDLGRAPANLVIVVDEFAALVKERPEFVDGMIDLAARGRSLGIHLILATQRPAGVINDKIRVNTNLRVSLRFVDDSDSRDVLGTAAAARKGLPPGRAFAKVGPAEPVEFQTAYAGSRVRTPEGEALLVRDLGFGGVVAGAATAAESSPDGDDTALHALLQMFEAANAKLELAPPRRPWLPGLPDRIRPEPIPLPEAPEEGPFAVIGLVDEPEHQLQRAEVYVLATDGNLLAYGGPGSGKTSLLRAVAAGLARASAAAGLHLYAVETGTAGLRDLEALPHCGAVIQASDISRVARLISMLRAEVERRRALLAEARAADFAAYVRKHEALARVVLLLDGFGGITSELADADLGREADALAALVSEGRPFGIHVVATAERRNAVPSRLTGSFGKRLVLQMPEDDDYTVLGIERQAYRGAQLRPGRGFLGANLEIQCAALGEDASPDAQSAALQALGAELSARAPRSAASVQLLPEQLEGDSLPAPSAPYSAVIGLTDPDLKPATVALEEGHFAIVGPPRSGRSTALVTLISSLARGPLPVHLICVAPRRQSPLSSWGGSGDVHVGAEACAAAIADLAGRLPTEAFTVLAIDDGEELAEGAVAQQLEQIVRRGRDLPIRVVAAVETQAAHRAFSGWIKELLKDRQGLLLNADPTADGALFRGVRLPRRRDWERVPPGRANLVGRASLEVVQVARTASSAKARPAG